MITHSNWLNVLANNALRNDIGVVGPLLCYEDDTIQHAGVVVGLNGYADHIFKGMSQEHIASNFVSPYVNRNVLAVTGACMAISKNTLQKIGVFDEKFVICGSDVEICIRAYKNGLRNLYTPRTKYIPEIDFIMSEKHYKYFWENGDPYYNLNLSLHSCIPVLKTAAEFKIKDGKRKKVKNMINKINTKIKTTLKKDKLIVKLYRKIKKIPNVIFEPRLGDYPLYEITPIESRKSKVLKTRINIANII